MEIIGNSQAINKVCNLIKQVATTNSNVLIFGESGTGKELVARNVHNFSSRSQYPFVPINCAAIPSELLESELFGHEKGAFTGALTAKSGRFEVASKGSIFLDEIGDMPLTMQVKILRILQEKSFERVGGTKTIESDARVIAATNQDLELATASGKFREDLFYRLNVFPIHLPPLRQRKEDIPLLVEFFINKLSDSMETCKIVDSALNALQSYDWPGNIRELSNFVERLCILYPNQDVSNSQIIQHLKPKSNSVEDRINSFESTIMTKKIDDSDFNLKSYMESIEVELIKTALNKTDGVVSKAADHLGIRRTTLVEKMKKYQLERNNISDSNQMG